MRNAWSSISPTIKRLSAALLTVSAVGLASIRLEEDVRTEAYLDDVGIPTICAGHTKGVVLGQRKTPGECEVLLREDASEAGSWVARCTHVALTQEQYDALVSFAINVGGPSYCASQLSRDLNAGKCRAAAAEFDSAPQIDRATGKPRIYHGRRLVDRATGRVLLSPGQPINKWTTGGGRPLTGLILRRGRERAMFETGCD